MGTGSVAITVVERVAAAENCSTLSLPPLAAVVDPDLLDTFASPRTTAQLTGGYLAFDYAGYAVVVSHGGRVSLEKESTGDESTA